MKRYQCAQCDSSFSRPYSLRRHVQRKHSEEEPVYDCQVCGAIFEDISAIQDHYRYHVLDNDFIQTTNMFDGVVKTYAKNHLNATDIRVNHAAHRAQMVDVVRNELNITLSIKLSIVLIISVVKFAIDGEIEDYLQIPFRSATLPVHQMQDVEKDLDSAIDEIAYRFDDFQQHGSGWVIDNIVQTRMEISQVRALNGGCCDPPFNDHTSSNDCFYLSVARVFLRTTNEHALRKFVADYVVKLYNGADIPVHVTDITKFLNMNPDLKLRVNVLYKQRNWAKKGREDEYDIYPVYTSKNIKSPHSLNLLLHKKVINDEIRHHYSYIPSLSKFLRREYRSNQSQRKSYENAHFCPNCLHKFSHSVLLERHEEVCFREKPRAIELSDEPIEFSKYDAQHKLPLVGFFDFESNCKSVEEDNQCLKCSEGSKCTHKTKIEQHQEPSAYCLIIVDPDGKIVYRRSYTGPDPVNHMITNLMKSEKSLFRLMSRYIFHDLTEAEEEEFQSATTCYLCKESLFNKSKDVRDAVRDHDHMTGKYIGAAHNACNLNRKVPRKIPLFCHNFQGYDSHLILKKLDLDKCEENSKHGDVTLKCLPLNTEKVRTLEVSKFIFLDSMSFLQGSLSELASDLTKSDENMTVLDQMKLSENDEERDLLLRKG